MEVQERSQPKGIRFCCKSPSYRESVLYVLPSLLTCQHFSCHPCCPSFPSPTPALSSHTVVDRWSIDRAVLIAIGVVPFSSLRRRQGQGGDRSEQAKGTRHFRDSRHCEHWICGQSVESFGNLPHIFSVRSFADVSASVRLATKSLQRRGELCASNSSSCSICLL